MKRLLVFTLLLVILPGALVFAGGGQEGTAATDGPVTLRVASGNANMEVEIRRQVAELYQEANPNVTIEMVYLVGDRFEKQQTMIAGGTAPDVLYLNLGFIAPFAALNALVPLDGFADAEGYAFEGIVPAALDLVRYDGKIWAMPFEVAPMGIIYNKTLFDEAGLDYPPTDWGNPDWDWDALLRTAQALTKDLDGDGTIDQFGIDVTPWKAAGWLFMNGASTTNADVTEYTLDEPEAIETYQFLQDLMYRYRVAPSPEVTARSNTDALFMSGRLGMVYFSRWLNSYRTIEDFEWDVAVAPINRSGDVGTLMPSLHFGISTQSRHQDIAWDFLKFLVSPGPQELNTASGMAVPVLQSVLESPVLLESGIVRNESVFAEGVAWGKDSPLHPRSAEYSGIINRAIADIWTGSAAPADVLPTLEEEVERLF